MNTSSPAAQPETITPEQVQDALKAQRRMLQAQCPLPPPRIPQADEDQYPIHIERWGEVGPQVLLIHGGVQGRIGGGPLTFERQQALAEAGFVVESVSRPGFGPSPSRGPDDMVEDARALATLIRQGAHVIGHSWGATEALLAVARQAERVRSLILVEPAIGPTIGGPAVLADPAVAEDLKTRMMAQFAARTPADSARIFASFMGDLGGDPVLGPQLSNMSDEDAHEFGCNGLAAKMASNEEILAAIGQLKSAGIPVLIVTGGYSASTDATGEVLARLTGGQHAIVPSPNHFVQYASAQCFNAVALDFIRSAGT